MHNKTLTTLGIIRDKMINLIDKFVHPKLKEDSIDAISLTRSRSLVAIIFLMLLLLIPLSGIELLNNHEKGGGQQFLDIADILICIVGLFLLRTFKKPNQIGLFLISLSFCLITYHGMRNGNLLSISFHWYYFIIPFTAFIAGTRPAIAIYALSCACIFGIYLHSKDALLDINTLVYKPFERTFEQIIIMFAILVNSIYYIHIQRSLLKAKKEKKDAEITNYAKTYFIANVSHELRTPLNIAYGNASLLLLDKNLTDEQIEHTQRIVDSTKQLQGIIDDLLSLMDFEIGNPILEMDKFDLDETIRKLIDKYKNRIAQQNLTCDLDLDINRDIYADQKRIRQVITHIIFNAIKFTPASNQIGIKTRIDKANIKIIIWDTGIGISPNYLKKIFNMFYQVEKGFTRSYEGMGVGLHIAHRILKAHGGNISVETNKNGKGTCFIIELPSNEKSIPKDC